MLLDILRTGKRSDQRESLRTLWGFGQKTENWLRRENLNRELLRVRLAGRDKELEDEQATSSNKSAQGGCVWIQLITISLSRLRGREREELQCWFLYPNHKDFFLQPLLTYSSEKCYSLTRHMWLLTEHIGCGHFSSFISQCIKW